MTTQDRLVVEKSSALWMCGSAMFTMVMSRTTINWHEAMTRSAIVWPPPRDSLVAVACGEAGCGLLPAVSTVRRYARPPHPTTRSQAASDGGSPGPFGRANRSN
ncbi:hypothetical protein GCM10010104_63120 [Streptomyces indiaensis]|uniref:Uncharacterized protein n=1 Tax=Streptomyces indiaensis TaxID=284033 RepID=A0ABN3EG62_9ACTN